MTTVPRKFLVTVIFCLAVLFFIFSNVSVAVFYILVFDFSEFLRSPWMAVTFTIGLFVLIVMLVSCVQILLHKSTGRKLFTYSGILAIGLSWVVIGASAIIYQPGEIGEIFGLAVFLTILFSPIYFMIYLINYNLDVIEWIEITG